VNGWSRLNWRSACQNIRFGSSTTPLVGPCRSDSERATVKEFSEDPVALAQTFLRSSAMGITVDTLTKEQADYLAGWESGT
jgi:hypothetical protein